MSDQNNQIDQNDPGEQDSPDFFTGEPMHDYFCRMATLNPSTAMAPSSSPQPLQVGQPFELPETYDYDGTPRSYETFFTETDTAALLVLEHGAIRYERYALTGGPDVPWLSMSVAKSFISALVGIALADGAIGSLDEPISAYAKVQPGSAYDGVSIRDVLQMSSGARWNEDYNDPDSDVFRLGAALAGVGTFDEVVATSVSELPPGTLCRYNSADTQALASLLVGATGRSLADYLHDKLLEPLGVVSPSQWLTDTTGRAAAAFGLNMTGRDYAKLGELYRNNGRWGERQLVPAEYVADSVSVTAPHTAPGMMDLSEEEPWDVGYGYQWWLPNGDAGEFCAIGVYNQFIYVHPERAAVIVKLSANRTYGTSTGEHTNRDDESLAFLRGIAHGLGSDEPTPSV